MFPKDRRFLDRHNLARRLHPSNTKPMTEAQAAALAVSATVTDPRAGTTGTVKEQARLSLADSAGIPQGSFAILWVNGRYSVFNYDDSVVQWFT